MHFDVCQLGARSKRDVESIFSRLLTTYSLLDGQSHRVSVKLISTFQANITTQKVVVNMVKVSPFLYLTRWVCFHLFLKKEAIMKIAVMKETFEGETRVPLIPLTVDKLVKLGAEVEIESGMGATCRYGDADYEAVGATVNSDRKGLLQSADIVLRLRKPPIEEVELMKKGCIHISYLDPFNELELVEKMKECSISCVSLEMLPRSTVAQKMDVLSSQANLGGYMAVIIGTEQLDKILPMMTTPAGTIKPCPRLYYRCRGCRSAGHCHGPSSRCPG